MKTFLKVFCSIIALGVIITLCYFFATPGGADLTMETGKYVLEEIITLEGGEETKEEFENSEYYLEVFEDKQIKSFSGDVGFVQDGKTYSYKVVGTGLSVYDGEKLVYEGYYIEDLIVIIISETFENDEGQEEIKNAIEIRYRFSEEN